MASLVKDNNRNDLEWKYQRMEIDSARAGPLVLTIFEVIVLNSFNSYSQRNWALHKLWKIFHVILVIDKPESNHDYTYLKSNICAEQN